MAFATSVLPGVWSDEQPERWMETPPRDRLAKSVGKGDGMKGMMAGSPDDVSWRHYPFLLRAGVVLTSSLDLERTLRRAVRLPLPDLGDWCALHLLGPDGALRFALAAHTDPSVEATASALWQEAFECDAEVRRRLTNVLRTATPDLVAAMPPGRERGGRIAPLAALLGLLDLQSLLVVPLRLRGHGVGVIALGSTTARTYRAEPVIAVARAYAQRVAAGLDHARALTRSRDALSARTVLVASGIHDLRNPLTVIKARAQALQHSLARGRAAADQQLPRAQALDEGLAAIDTAATGIAEIVDDLLALLRDPRGKAPVLRRQRHDLLALARRAVTTYQQLAPQYQIALNAPAIERIEGDFDAREIARALGNLLDNAIKYSPPGGRIAVEVTCQDHLEGDPPPWAVVRVSDQGIGIPESDLAAIFQPFVRAGNVRRRTPGNGVGLAGVRQIVERHGGAISVESTLGQGSTFIIRLPLRPPHRASAPPAAPAHVTPLLAGRRD